jgi:hypothetical protein
MALHKAVVMVARVSLVLSQELLQLMLAVAVERVMLVRLFRVLEELVAAVMPLLLVEPQLLGQPILAVVVVLFMRVLVVLAVQVLSFFATPAQLNFLLVAQRSM